jgi:pyruvate dehydrogenase E2 component (dihydrolipoamide acetyltransferase)
VSKSMIRVPDVGSSDPVDVIEISVKVGDTIAAEDTIIVLESDKATVEVPAPQGGKITAIGVKVGDRVKEGDELMEVEAEGESEEESSAESGAASDAPEASEEKPDTASKPQEEDESGAPQEQQSGGSETVTVPDLGDIDSAEIIEVNVAAGDSLEAEQVIVVLESDKASLEIPAPSAGKVESVAVKVGDKVGTGDALLTLAVSEGKPAAYKNAEAEGPARTTAKTGSSDLSVASGRFRLSLQIRARRPGGAQVGPGNGRGSGPGQRHRTQGSYPQGRCTCLGKTEAGRCVCGFRWRPGGGVA